MPKKKPSKLDRCASQVQSSGKSKDASYAICNASINGAKKKKKGKK